MPDKVSPKSETFHPVHERGSEAWFPANEAAALLVQISHVWEDLTHLRDIRSAQEDQYKKQLLLKYVVIEVKSLVDLFDRLSALAMKAPVFDPSERQGWREITAEEKQQTQLLLKDYSQEKSKVERTIANVRNEVGAHRRRILPRFR